MEKLIIFRRSVHDLRDYRDFAKVAARLKPWGKVCVEISDLAEKSWCDLPEVRSPWHEYATYLTSIHKFFPHPKIAEHLPMDWVAKNRELLMGKAEILSEFDLGAFYFGCDPFFLPYSFYAEHPHLRGPRVDHPRRSNRAEFSYCCDQPEGLELLETMIGELKRNVPHLASYQFLTNDSGGGFCWSDYLYSGRNGPRHCQLRNAGERIRDVLQAVHNGAIKNGGDIDVHIKGNLTQYEHDMVLPIAPENTYLAANFRGDPKSMSVGNVGVYPARGLMDPLALINGIQRFQNENIRTCFIRLDTGYNRGPELVSTIDKLVDVVEDCLREPTSTLFSRLERLRKLASAWGGPENADKVMEAFYSMNESMGGTRKHSAFFEGVSTRHINRPMVVKPDLLSPEEESYFLPHIFNNSDEEARQDYVDIHGGRKDTAFQGDWFWDGGFRGALNSLIATANKLESIDDAPESEWFKQVGTSLRIYASVVRSCNNFFFAQVFRDRYKEALAGEPIDQRKVRVKASDNFAQWYEISQDELHNTEELIRLLENGGSEILVTSNTRKEEDTFVLGPDIVDHLKKKVKVMLDHWLDVQNYVESPNT